MKNLVIGASGQVGQALMSSLSGYEAAGTYCSTKIDGFYLDIQDQQSIVRLLSDVSPEVVFVPAAFTHVDSCSLDKRSFEINVVGIKNIVESINSIDNYRRKPPLLIYFSTDYVFDGEDGPYSERDIVNPINQYGRQKLLAEHILSTTYSNFIIIRTTGVFGPDKQNKNFVTRLVEDLKNNKQIAIPEDEFGSPTYAPDMADALIAMLKNIGVFYRCRSTHIINVAGSEVCSRYDFAKEICRVFDCDEKLIIPTNSKYIRTSPRPLKAGLRTDKINKMIGRKMLSYKEGLDNFIKVSA